MTQPTRPLHSVPAGLLGPMQAIRRRLRLIAGADGLAAVLLLVSVLVVVTFLLDWGLDLPVSVRAVIVVISAGVLVYGLAQRLLLPLTRRIGDDRLALEIERSHPGLSDLYISAVQLAREPASDFASPALVARVIEDATRRAGEVDVRRAAPARRMLGHVGVGVLLATLVGGALAANQELAATWAQRVLLLSPDVAWPRAVDLAVVRPEDRTVTVIRGDDLVVEVEVRRGEPGRVLAWVRSPDGRVEAAGMTGHGSRRFRRVFENVTEPFAFWVEGGDAVTPDHQVRVRLRPAVGAIRTTYRYPPYTGLESITKAEGQVIAPEGTEILVDAESILPVEQASLIVEGPDPNAEHPAPVPAEIRAGTRFASTFRIRTNGRYGFLLVDVDGIRNDPPVLYPIRAIPDRSPIVRIERPGRNRDVTIEAMVPLLARAEDDYGIASGRLVAQVVHAGSGEEPVEEERALDGFAAAGQEAVAETVVTVADLAERVGDRIRYRVEAVDEMAPPNVGRSPEFTLTVVGRDELGRAMDDHLLRVRDALREARKNQEDLRREVGDAEERHRTGQTKAEAEERRVLRSAEGEQQKLARRLDRAREDLEGVLREKQENRILASGEEPWLEEMAGQLSELGSGPVQEAASAVRRAASGGEAVKSLNEAGRAQDQVVAGLADLVERLDKWSDVNEVVRDLDTLLRDETRIHDETKGRLPR